MKASSGSGEWPRWRSFFCISQIQYGKNVFFANQHLLAVTWEISDRIRR